jgi:hypothetical protein
MLETYLLALPIRKVENCQMSNIKHLFTKQSLNQKTFCLIRIDPLNRDSNLHPKQNSLDSWENNSFSSGNSESQKKPRYLTFGFGKI